MFEFLITLVHLAAINFRFFPDLAGDVFDGAPEKVAHAMLKKSIVSKFKLFNKYIWSLII